jgi:hypothetical protein
LLAGVVDRGCDARRLPGREAGGSEGREDAAHDEEAD